MIELHSINEISFSDKETAFVTHHYHLHYKMIDGTLHFKSLTNGEFLCVETWNRTLIEICYTKWQSKKTPIDFSKMIWE